MLLFLFAYASILAILYDPIAPVVHVMLWTLVFVKIASIGIVNYIYLVIDQLPSEEYDIIARISKAKLMSSVAYTSLIIITSVLQGWVYLASAYLVSTILLLMAVQIRSQLVNARRN